MTPDMNIPKVKLPFLSIFFAVFLSFGIVFFVVITATIIEESAFSAKALTTTAIIESSNYSMESGDGFFLTKINYTVDNNTYSTIIKLDDEYRPSEQIQIYCNPQNPRDISLYQWNPISLVFMIIPIVFLLVGGIGLFKQLSTYRRAVRVIKGGYKITAQNISVEPVMNIMIQGRHPFMIVCSYSDSIQGSYHEFRSSYFRRNPKGALTDLGIDTIEVYVDPNNYKNYYVDTSFLNIK